MEENMQTVKPLFRSAFPADIGAWSWGSVELPRSSSNRWQDKKRTLDDETIFGPRESYRCFCGKISGQDFEGLFCDSCWSIIETSESRKIKFGTIALQQPIPHPFEEFPTDLWRIPVLPAAIREEHTKLDSLYDQIVLNAQSSDNIKTVFGEIIAKIWPSFHSAKDRDDQVILGRGMAITPRREPAPQPLALWRSRICTKCHSADILARGEFFGKKSN
jgi:hypothetical protein